MKLITSLNSILGLLLLMLMLTTGITVAQERQERHVLQYDAPATDNLLVRKKGRSKGIGYIQTALPLGNGRLGAMSVSYTHLTLPTNREV